MQVKARFVVSRFESSHYRKTKDHSKPYSQENSEVVEQRTVVLHPVYGNGNPEHPNTKFWEATPSGEIRLGILNQAAWEGFPLGAEIDITFEVAK